MRLKTVTEGNRLRWDGKTRPFHEVYYLKLTDPLGEWAFWSRYTILSPQTSGQAPQACLWAIFTSLSGKKIALQKHFSLAELDIFHCDSFIQIGQNHINLAESRGALSSREHLIDWLFEFEDPTHSTHLFPYGFLYSLPIPKTKFVEPRFTTYVTGHLTIDENQYALRRCPAHQAHLWGTAYADRWTWGHCNAFLEDPDAAFEGLVAEIPLGSRKSPPLALFQFRYQGKMYRANSFFKWFTNEHHGDFLEWRFKATCKNLKFEGILRRKPELTVGLNYEGPNGEKRFCHNSTMAEMELNIFEREKGRWAFKKRLTSPTGAAFETVEPSPDSRIDFLL